ncbi:MAG: hypothetical protein V4691_08415 [Pseudomonadota bacterium]
MTYIEPFIANPLMLLVVLALIVACAGSFMLIKSLQKRGINLNPSYFRLIGALAMCIMLAIIFIPIVLYDNFFTEKDDNSRAAHNSKLALAIRGNEMRFENAKLKENSRVSACTYASSLTSLHSAASDSEGAEKWRKVADDECNDAEVLADVTYKTAARYEKAKSAGKNQMEICICASMLADLYRKANKTEFFTKWGKIAHEECANATW